MLMATAGAGLFAATAGRTATAPGGLAQTFVGLRSAVSMALVIVIVAEMFIGSESGLGHRIIDAQQVFNVKELYTSILVTGALGYLLNLLVQLIEKKLIHWSGKA